jgi:hypothetical protein
MHGQPGKKSLQVALPVETSYVPAQLFTLHACEAGHVLIVGAQEQPDSAPVAVQVAAPVVVL